MKRVFRHPAFWMLVINFPGIFIPPVNFFNWLAGALVLFSCGWLIRDAITGETPEHW